MFCFKQNKPKKVGPKKSFNADLSNFGIHRTKKVLYLKHVTPVTVVIALLSTWLMQKHAKETFCGFKTCCSWIFTFLQFLDLVMEKGLKLKANCYLWMLMVVIILDCEDKWPCLTQRVADTQCKYKRYCSYILWLDDSTVHIWDHMPWHRKFFLSLYGECSCSLFLPSGKVLLLMAVYSTARAWIFTGWTKCRRTSTSHKYLFSTFLPASAFIYWLFGNFVWLRRNRRHTNGTGRRLKKTQRMSQRDIFLSAFYIPRELPSPTTRVVSHNSGPFWSEETQIEEWKRKTEQMKEKRG